MIQETEPNVSAATKRVPCRLSVAGRLQMSLVAGKIEKHSKWVGLAVLRFC